LIENQRQLIKTEERFRILTETAPNLFWMADASGNVNFFNQKWTDFTGYDLEASLHAPLLIHPDDRSPMMDLWNLSLITRKPFEAEYRLRRRDGEYRWHLARALPLLDETGQALNWFGSLTDVHDQKVKANELAQLTIRENSALESSRLKSEFLATMSHEIRTPINGVIGMTTLLLDTALSADQKEYADAIKRSGDALLTLFNDILGDGRNSPQQISS
jgi:PAS domain S-box-containing protein